MIGYSMANESEELSYPEIEQLLDALRTEFSVTKYDGLDEKLAKLEDSLREILAGLMKEEVEISSSNVALNLADNDFFAPDSGLYIVGCFDNRQRLELCLCLNSSSFRLLLNTMLGGTKNASNQPNESVLSDAERKLLKRFSKQLHMVLGEELEFGQKGSEFELFNHSDFAKSTNNREMIRLDYDLVLRNTKFKLSFLVPLDILDPVSHAGQSGYSNVAYENRQEKWALAISKNVEGVYVPLFAELATLEMNLIDVAKLKTGSSLQVEFALGDVKITGGEEAGLFHANINLCGPQMTMQIKHSTDVK